MITFIHTDDHNLNCFLPNEDSTLQLGKVLAKKLVSPLCIWLHGDLGAGKTTLVRGILQTLGHTGNVKSPTYTLLEPYVVSRIALYHFDFYRLTQPDEFNEAGLEEYFSQDAICLVEWPEQAVPYVPEPDIEIFFSVTDDGRHVRLQGKSHRGQICLNGLNPDHT